jgi:hypothetical protein
LYFSYVSENKLIILSLCCDKVVFLNKQQIELFTKQNIEINDIIKMLNNNLKDYVTSTELLSIDKTKIKTSFLPLNTDDFTISPITNEISINEKYTKTVTELLDFITEDLETIIENLQSKIQNTSYFSTTNTKK